MIIKKTYQDLKPFLMEVSKNKVKEPYFLVKTDGQVIFLISSGMNSSEYNKTEGFISNFEGVITYQCLYGQGLALMQRMDEEGEAKEFKVVTLSQSKQFLLPAGWAMCLVNISKNLLVVLANLDIDSKDLDSKPILEKSGFAYFVLEKKGEIAFEQNPNYSVYPQIATE